jgi:hypothetical protein
MGCALPPFGVCANLTFCDESTDSQEFPPFGWASLVNQLRNIGLGTSNERQNIVNSAAWLFNRDMCPYHPQSFPQVKVTRA